MVRLGISACFFHPDPQRPLFKGKRLLYVEQELIQWALNHHVIAYLVPHPIEKGKVTFREITRDLDGLILQGGSDVAPASYGETPLKPEWKGDYYRDQYEIALVQEFRKQKKPILGVCRGAQLLNVAFGGTLYQDIPTQFKTTINHRNWEIYEQNHHEVAFAKDSMLAKVFKREQVTVNSIHHQGLKDLGKDLIVEATAPDGMIEAIRHKKDPFVFAFQWHPEFHFIDHRKFLDCSPVFEYFLKEVKKRKRK